jgi:hypothetical protein
MIHGQQNTKISSRLVIGSGQSEGDHVTRDFTDTCCHRQEIPASQSRFCFYGSPLAVTGLLPTPPIPISRGWAKLSAPSQVSLGTTVLSLPLTLSDPMSDLVRHYDFPVPGAFLDLQHFPIQFFYHPHTPQLLFILGGKEVGGLLVIILQF